MKAVAAQAAAALAAQAVKPIVLVVLTTYADRGAGTVDATYYFSDRPVLYDYGNTGTVRQFEAFLLGVSDLVESISHVPQTRAAGLEREVRVTLANTPYRGGSLLIRELRAHHLPFARVEVATVYGLPDPETGWYNLRSLAGDEHIVDFRGEVVQPEGIDDDLFQLLCKTEEISVPWLRATDETAVDPKDLGQRLPAPFGAAKKVPCVNLVVGWTTTLGAALSASSGAGAVISCSDATGFPTASFLLRAGGEEITVASRGSASDPLVVSARGENGTLASEHPAGEVVLEVPSETIIAVASYAVSDIPALYCRNPYNDSLFLVTQGTENLSDTTAISGQTIATVRFSQEQLRSLLEACQQSAQVAQQAEYVTAGNLSQQIVQPSSAGQLEVADFLTPLRTFNSSPTSPRFTWTNTTQTALNAEARLTFGALPDIDVVACRLIFKGTMNTVGVFGTGNARRLQLIPYSMAVAGFPQSAITLDQFAANGTQTLTKIVAGGGGWNLQALQNAYFKFSAQVPFSGSNSANYGELASGWGLEIDYYDGSDLATRIVDARVEGASVGFGLDFYVDVDGPTIPVLYSDGYSFEETSGWNASGCAVAADSSVKDAGTYSLRITPTLTLIDSCDAVGSWTGGSATLTQDTSDKTEGTGAIVVTGAGNVFRSASKSVSSFDLTGKLIAVDVKLESASTWAAYGCFSQTLGIIVQVGTGANIQQWTFGSNDGLTDTGYVTLLFDWSTRPPYFVSGTPPTYTAIDSIAIYGYQGLNGGTVAYRFDNFRVIQKTSTVQRNATAGTVDLTATSSTYALALRATTDAVVESGTVYFSNTAGSGTTPPSDRRVITLAQGNYGDGAFETTAFTATDTGSPGVSNVETIGATVTLVSVPPGELLDAPVVYIDTLRRRDDAGNPYAGAVGALIEKPPDVARWFNAIFCGKGDSFLDSATFGTAETNLAAIDLAGDFRTLGVDWPEVMERLGYESRANFLRTEAASSTVLKMLCAEADYTFPAATGDRLTEIGRLSEVGRDGRELATRFQWAYARDWSIGDALEAYHGLVRIDPAVSDVATPAAGTLTTLESLWGRRDAQVGVFLAHQAEAGAEDVAGYYAAEATREAGLFILTGCAWWQVPGIEVGDVREVLPRWRASALKLRVIEVSKRFGSGVVDVRAVEVN